MSEIQRGELLRAALAILTYPEDAGEEGVLALIANWGLVDYADYIGARQYIFEEVTHEAPEAVARVVERLRRESLDRVD